MRPYTYGVDCDNDFKGGTYGLTLEPCLDTCLTDSECTFATYSFDDGYCGKFKGAKCQIKISASINTYMKTGISYIIKFSLCVCV